MQNTTFDKLKWIAIIVIPALATFVGVVGKATNWQYTDLTVIVITAIGTFLGTILGVTNRSYTQMNNKED
ncbi:phage holin [Enterococcus sp. 22-H-5-01]|uniref:phage holin n=1 Tax=Enterococcus sp. 22-H-5-01 TaxID=3418555 RepID=UPI003D0857C5